MQRIIFGIIFAVVGIFFVNPFFSCGGFTFWDLIPMSLEEVFSFQGVIFCFWTAYWLFTLGLLIQRKRNTLFQAFLRLIPGLSFLSCSILAWSMGVGVDFLKNLKPNAFSAFIVLFIFLAAMANLSLIFWAFDPPKKNLAA